MPIIPETHCAPHKLNLVAQQASKNFPSLQRYQRLVGSIYGYLTNNASRQTRLKEMTDILETDHAKNTPIQHNQPISINRLFKRLAIDFATIDFHDGVPKRRVLYAIDYFSRTSILKKYLDMSYDDLLEECSKVEVQLSDSERKLIKEDTRDQARGSFLQTQGWENWRFDQ
uniref:Uncharacterized protein n=1 Tax=Branchiostoma floridae TaxID=7739 RepID=C3Y884_BRAFL|eukprot:XP_002607543.1 hypothetical protein BRAFLDRAFT_106492 [Branchiostoma floridae]